MFNQNFNVCFKYKDRFILLKFISLNERKRFAALWYTSTQQTKLQILFMQKEYLAKLLEIELLCQILFIDS